MNEHEAVIKMLERRNQRIADLEAELARVHNLVHVRDAEKYAALEVLNEMTDCCAALQGDGWREHPTDCRNSAVRRALFPATESEEGRAFLRIKLNDARALAGTEER